jgi:hypothetical protein
MSAEDWLKNSIMAKRAVAKGATGGTHSLTIEQRVCSPARATVPLPRSTPNTQWGHRS